MPLRSTLLTFRGLTLLFTSAAFLFACASDPAQSTKKKKTPIDPGEDYFGDAPSEEQGLAPTSNEDSGAFGASERPAPTGKDAGPTAYVDAGGGDSGTVAIKTYCQGPLLAGDLMVSELLLTSRTGSGDDGEWVEIKSTRTCWLKVKGVSIESPRGTLAPNAMTITEDFELEPKGTFIVADSADPTKNHGLPGKVFAWDAADVLKNDGDTVKVALGATVLDTVTYPAFSNLEQGRSLSFPEDCPGNVHGDWTRWSLSFAAWKAGFKGTPNAANADVACY